MRFALLVGIAAVVGGCGRRDAPEAAPAVVPNAPLHVSNVAALAPSVPATRARYGGEAVDLPAGIGTPTQPVPTASAAPIGVTVALAEGSVLTCVVAADGTLRPAPAAVARAQNSPATRTDVPADTSGQAFVPPDTGNEAFVAPVMAIPATLPAPNTPTSPSSAPSPGTSAMRAGYGP